MIYALIFLLTAAVVAALGFGAIRHGAGGSSVAVYKDQLRTLANDAGPEADALRLELSRRLLAAARQETDPAGASKLSPLAFALAIPLIALPLYWLVGNPVMPDVPLGPRLASAIANNDYPAMVMQIEKHLNEKPDDVAGWKVLATAYQELRRYTDAGNAYLQIARLEKPTADVLTNYGEMLTLANQGLITPDAAAAFTEALKLDAAFPKARFFLAMNLKQEGKLIEAKTSYQALLDSAPANAPWRTAIQSELAALSVLASPDQPAMIKGMVEGLQAKLDANPDDLEGWLKLIRARSVLNEADKARSSLDIASTLFKDKPEAIAALKNLRQELKLQ